MTTKTLLLTGGNGMVGQNILAHPDLAEWTVLAPRRAELDLTKEHDVRGYIDAHKPDVIVHAAGRVGGIQANIKNPVAFLDENNVMGRNIVMAAYEAGVTKFLNLASTCMYPRAAQNPLAEDLVLTGELEPTNEGYALAKIMTTRLCQYIQRERPDLNYKTLIPCNLYGYHDTFDPQRSHLVPAIIHKMHMAKVENTETVEIWGDGTARREFMFAGDLADAVIKAANDIDSLPDLMNVGLGEDYTINEYYAMAAEVVGWEGRFVHNLDKPVGMKQKLCATDRLSAWGWKPPTSVKEGLAKTYRHYLERHAS